MSVRVYNRCATSPSPCSGPANSTTFRVHVRDSGPLAEAIGSGREAGISIDRYIKGQDLRLGRLGRDKVLRPITEPQRETYDPSARGQMPHLEPQERVDNFKEIQKGCNEEVAIREGKRCIMCGTSCVQACPYDVMQFNHEVLQAVKCDLCIDTRGREEAPACTSICPTQCILWGDPAAFPSGSKIVV